MSVDLSRDRRSVDTADVNLQQEVRHHNALIKQIADRAEPTRANDEWPEIQGYHHLHIFFTGITGVIGRPMARYLVLQGNHIYPLIRGTPDFHEQNGGKFVSAERRIEIWVKRNRLTEYTEFVHPIISSGYNRPRLGMSDEDWEFCCRNMDVIFGFGARTALNMTWSKAVVGVLDVSLALIEISLTYRVKPLVVAASTGLRAALAGAPGQNMCRGYSMSKLVDMEGWMYLRHLTGGHPLRLVFAGYVVSLEYQIPSILNSVWSFFWLAFQTKKMCPGSVPCELVDADDLALAVFHNAKFIPRLEKQENNIVLGAFSDPRWQWSWDDLHDMMKEVQPEMESVGETYEVVDAAYELISKKPDSPQKIAFAKMFQMIHECTAHELDDTLTRLFTCPSNNMNLGVPSRETLLQVLRVIKDRPYEEFHKYGTVCFEGYYKDGASKL